MTRFRDRLAVALNRIAAGPMASMHTRMYQRSDGKRGSEIDGNPVALLTTTGRKSRRAFTTPLLCFERDGAYIVVGSNAGRDNHPAWVYNLRASAEGELQLGAERFRVTAREAAPEESTDLWPMLNAGYAGYEHYKTLTDRTIPIFILERR